MPDAVLSAVLLTVVYINCPAPSAAVERVRWTHEGERMSLDGELVVKAADGGLLLLSPDGRLFAVPPDELVSHENDRAAFAPLGADELARKLKEELPAGFDSHVTQHYLICYNTSRAYAQWCGALFERLYRAFNNFWVRRGFDLTEPRFPLVALVFADRDSYDEYARAELGEASASMIGYYNLQTNRMTMYDLTGIEAVRRPGDRRTSAAQINAMLSRPAAERTVATVIHEATHQLAFNCGLQTRYAHIPLWFSEGIAMYFETPDLASAKGWRTIGAVNRRRLQEFREYQSRRPADSLATLIASDERLRDPRQADNAYCESWALNYFLIRQRSSQYLAYLRLLSEKAPLIVDDEATRLAEFRQAFGQDLEALDAEFIKAMSKVQ